MKDVIPGGFIGMDSASPDHQRATCAQPNGSLKWACIVCISHFLLKVFYIYLDVLFVWMVMHYEGMQERVAKTTKEVATWCGKYKERTAVEDKYTKVLLHSGCYKIPFYLGEGLHAC